MFGVLSATDLLADIARAERPTECMWGQGANYTRSPCSESISQQRIMTSGPRADTSHAGGYLGAGPQIVTSAYAQRGINSNEIR